MALQGSTFRQVEVPGLETAAASLLVAGASEGRVLQVTAAGVRLLGGAGVAGGGEGGTEKLGSQQTQEQLRSPPLQLLAEWHAESKLSKTVETGGGGGWGQ
jgi:hypothetical protein